MHNLSRPEQEEGVSQLGLTGPEMEIARRNFIRPRTFSRTNRTFTLSSRVSRDIRCSGWVITIWLFLYFNALMVSFVMENEFQRDGIKISFNSLSYIIGLIWRKIILLDVKENLYSIKILGFYIFRKIRVRWKNEHVVNFINFEDTTMKFTRHL